MNDWHVVRFTSFYAKTQAGFKQRQKQDHIFHLSLKDQLLGNKEWVESTETMENVSKCLVFYLIPSLFTFQSTPIFRSRSLPFSVHTF